MKRTKNSLNSEQGVKIKKTDVCVELYYPASEDIYIKGKQEAGIEPGITSGIKELSETYTDAVKKNGAGNQLAAELDVPGSELDDQLETIGSEDEENNYYSLGLDNHNELEENKE